jgi:uncharacterized RDD family membrane protein YckC
MVEVKINTESQVENPSIQTIFERAKFGDRFFASMVDGIIVVTPLRLVEFILTVLIQSWYVSLINVFIVLLVFFWYFSYFPYKNNGQTLGKKWLKIRIANLDGNSMSLGHFVVRDLVKNGILIVLQIIFGYAGTLWALTYLLALTKDRKALHDIIARTQVLKVENVVYTGGK